MVQNPTNDAAHSSYDELEKNAPTALAGRESNWVETGSRQGLLPDVPPLQPR
jgi:hypothetical protein